MSTGWLSTGQGGATIAVVNLAQLIQARMDELGIRYGRELARRTESAPGGAVNQSTIAKYRSGVLQQPDERTLRSLAHALNVPVRRLREAAGLPTDAPEHPFVLPPEADYLTAKEREAVLGVVRVLLDRHRSPLRLVEEVVEEDVVIPPAEKPGPDVTRPGCGRNAT